MIYDAQFYDIDQNNDPNNTMMLCGVKVLTVVLILECGIILMVLKYLYFTGAFDDSSAPRPLFSKRFNGQIALARRAGLAGIEGLYTCIIPDENG